MTITCTRFSKVPCFCPACTGTYDGPVEPLPAVYRNPAGPTPDQPSGERDAILGTCPQCDGDNGYIVRRSTNTHVACTACNYGWPSQGGEMITEDEYWNRRKQTPEKLGRLLETILN